jgi:hypothetical protein
VWRGGTRTMIRKKNLHQTLTERCGRSFLPDQAERHPLATGVIDHRSSRSLPHNVRVEFTTMTVATHVQLPLPTYTGIRAAPDFLRLYYQYRYCTSQDHSSQVARKRAPRSPEGGVITVLLVNSCVHACTRGGDTTAIYIYLISSEPKQPAPPA